MDKTKRGIFLNLKKSPYTTTIYYDDIEIKYYFSSSLYNSKFEIERDLNREWINNSLSKRFKLDFESNLLCDINLYSKVEKRGFYIVVNGQEILCLNSIRLDGNKVIMKS